MIEHVENQGVKRKADTAQEWDIPPSALSTIMKNKVNNLGQFNKQELSPVKEKMREASLYPDVEEVLLPWFKSARSVGKSEGLG